jgi:hypothetical protein
MHNLPENIQTDDVRMLRWSRMHFFALALMTLVSCWEGPKSPPTVEKKATPEKKAITLPEATWLIAEDPRFNAKDDFCVDIGFPDLHQWVQRKINILESEIPDIKRLLEIVRSIPGIHIRYVNQTGYEKVLWNAGATNTEIRGLGQIYGAQTHRLEPPHTSSPDIKKEFVVCFGPMALQNKYNFIEGVTNELTGIIIDNAFPLTIKPKKRELDSRGGIVISAEEMDGLWKEFTKEFISGFMGTVVRERAEGRNEMISLSAIKKNLDNHQFHSKDLPDYALDYYDKILTGNWFPLPQNPSEKIRFYHTCINTWWPNMSNALKEVLKVMQVAHSE